jgi:hypothetical protein
MDHISEIFWDSGYSQAVAAVKAEYEEKIKKGMEAFLPSMIVPPEMEDEDGMAAPDNHVNSYR